jgi:hypothetical protein
MVRLIGYCNGYGGQRLTTPSIQWEVIRASSESRRYTMVSCPRAHSDVCEVGDGISLWRLSLQRISEVPLQ